MDSHILCEKLIDAIQMAINDSFANGALSTSIPEIPFEPAKGINGPTDVTPMYYKQLKEFMEHYVCLFIVQNTSKEKAWMAMGTRNPKFVRICEEKYSNNGKDRAMVLHPDDANGFQKYTMRFNKICINSNPLRYPYYDIEKGLWKTVPYSGDESPVVFHVMTGDSANELRRYLDAADEKGKKNSTKIWASYFRTKDQEPARQTYDSATEARRKSTDDALYNKGSKWFRSLDNIREPWKPGYRQAVINYTIIDKELRYMPDAVFFDPNGNLYLYMPADTMTEDEKFYHECSNANRIAGKRFGVYRLFEEKMISPTYMEMLTGRVKEWQTNNATVPASHIRQHAFRADCDYTDIQFDDVYSYWNICNRGGQEGRNTRLQPVIRGQWDRGINKALKNAACLDKYKDLQNFGILFRINGDLVIFKNRTFIEEKDEHIMDEVNTHFKGIFHLDIVNELNDEIFRYYEPLTERAMWDIRDKYSDDCPYLYHKRRKPISIYTKLYDIEQNLMFYR